MNKDHIINKKIEWESSSQGTTKVKQGKVLAVIPPGDKVEKICPELQNLGGSQKKYSPKSSNWRLLVEVKRFSNKTGKCLRPHYYTPSINKETLFPKNGIIYSEIE